MQCVTDENSAGGWSDCAKRPIVPSNNRRQFAMVGNQAEKILWIGSWRRSEIESKEDGA
jgi:hypothetical protein